MEIKIKRFGVEMNVKNTGIEFEVHDNRGKFRGDFYVTKSSLIWCQGKIIKKNGVKVSWDDFIDWMES